MGIIQEDWEEGWKEYFIREFANMTSSLWTIYDAVTEVIDRIEGKQPCQTN